MGEYRNENWVKLWAQIELLQNGPFYTTYRYKRGYQWVNCLAVFYNLLITKDIQQSLDEGSEWYHEEHHPWPTAAIDECM